jgi:sensor histidine kinase YesM
VICIFGTGITKLLLQQVAGLRWQDAAIDAGVSIGLMASGTWLLLIAINAYPTRVGAQLYAFVLAALLASVLCLTDMSLLKWLSDAENTAYRQWLPNTIWLRFFIGLIGFGWIASLAAMQKKADKLEKDFRQQADAATLLREAELYKLRHQLQPHFLYNSLNSISALILIAPDKAQEMIGRLSDFLRSSVKREGKESIPVQEELGYIEAYLSIEAVRFGDRLQVIFDKEYTDKASIPPFLMQPVLENAIKFGLYGKTGAVVITMHIALEDEMLTITVSNPYDAAQKPPSGTGFGLDAISRRLYLLYARTDLLETHQHNNIFTTTLKIPQNV